jgi:hypothetical protein
MLIKMIRARLTATDEWPGDDGSTMLFRLDEVDDHAPLLLASSRAWTAALKLYGGGGYSRLEAARSGGAPARSIASFRRPAVGKTVSERRLTTGIRLGSKRKEKGARYLRLRLDGDKLWRDRNGGSGGVQLNFFFCKKKNEGRRGV